MQSTKELFELNPIIFKNMTYQDVLILKRKQAILLLKKETEINYLKRDYHRMTELTKAIKNMDRLLDELMLEKCTKLYKQNTFTKFIKYIKQKIRKN